MEMVFTILDSKAGTHGNLTTSKNAQTCIRSVEDLLAQKTEPFYSHPEDFSLWHIGYYDPESKKELLDGIVPVHIVSFHHIAHESIREETLNGSAALRDLINTPEGQSIVPQGGE